MEIATSTLHPTRNYKSLGKTANDRKLSNQNERYQKSRKHNKEESQRKEPTTQPHCTLCLKMILPETIASPLIKNLKITFKNRSSIATQLINNTNLAIDLENPPKMSRTPFLQRRTPLWKQLITQRYCKT